MLKLLLQLVTLKLSLSQQIFIDCLLLPRYCASLQEYVGNRTNNQSPEYQASHPAYHMPVCLPSSFLSFFLPLYVFYCLEEY